MYFLKYFLIQFGKIMSSNKVTKYIDNFNFDNFYCDFENVYILSDSKEKYLKSPSFTVKIPNNHQHKLSLYSYPGLDTKKVF